MLPPLPRCSGWAYSSLISPSRISLPRKGCRVGLHIVLFEACSAFTRVAACTLARSPIRDPHSEGFSHFVTSMTAPVASGWSGCRVGLAPTGKRRPSRRTPKAVLQSAPPDRVHGAKRQVIERSGLQRSPPRGPTSVGGKSSGLVRNLLAPTFPGGGDRVLVAMSLSSSFVVLLGCERPYGLQAQLEVADVRRAAWSRGLIVFPVHTTNRAIPPVLRRDPNPTSPCGLWRE